MSLNIINDIERLQNFTFIKSLVHRIFKQSQLNETEVVLLFKSFIVPICLFYMYNIEIIVNILAKDKRLKDTLPVIQISSEYVSDLLRTGKKLKVVWKSGLYPRVQYSKCKRHKCLVNMYIP